MLNSHNIININKYKINNHINILNEAYVGKTKTLLEIEDAIGEARNANLSYYSEISKDKKITDINRLIEKQFGMDIFCLKIDNDKSPNAGTLPIARNIDIMNEVDLTQIVEATPSDGYRFKKGNGFCILVEINYGLLFNPDFTNEEIVAVLLHEIGHNFADCLYDKIRFANFEYMKMIQKLMVESSTKSVYKEVYERVYNSYRREQAAKYYSEKKSKIKGIAKGLGSNISNFRAVIKSILYRLNFKRVGKIENALRYKEVDKLIYKDSHRRDNEVFADKFAGVYGYGPAQSSALVKMDYRVPTSEKILNSLGIEKIKKINRDYDKALFDTYDLDEHPVLIQRINEEIKLVKNELSRKDLDPKLKKELEFQLDQMQELINKITEINKKLPTYSQIHNEYNRKVLKSSPDAVDEEIENAIEDALNKLLEEYRSKSKKKGNK